MNAPRVEAQGESEARYEMTWLATYYLARASVSFIWIGIAITLGAVLPIVAAGLLIFHIAWDAAANFLDASYHGGLRRNLPQTLNAIFSILATLGIACAVTAGTEKVLIVFGGWAMIAGVAQIATAIRRWWAHNAQWVMVLSGVQSLYAGMWFIAQAFKPGIHVISDFAPYVTFGAGCHLVSGLWLALTQVRRVAAQR